MTDRSELLLLGGRSGVGKTSVAAEMHGQLSAAGIRHCLIEGDNLDLAHPPPWEHHLAERNLAAMWANYVALGYRREIGTELPSHVERSDRAARELEELSPGWVHRMATDGRPVAELAAEIIVLTGWAE